MNFCQSMVCCYGCLMQAFRKLDETAGKLTDQLRKAAKQVKLDHSWYTV